MSEPISSPVTSPGIELQAEIYARLSSKPELLNELGGNRIYDEAPPKTKPPYVLFTKSIQQDWSTATEEGARHLVTLEIWSSRNGRKQVLVIENLMRQALSGLGGRMTDHHLVRFTHQQTETDVIVRENRFRCRVTFEAVTEPTE